MKNWTATSMRCGLKLLVAATVVLLATAGAAAAFSTAQGLTLAELVNDGESFESKNGDFLFSNFRVEILSGSADLSKYHVYGRSNGFTLSGTRSFWQPDAIEMVLEYDVAVLADDQQLSAIGISANKWHHWWGKKMDIDVLNAEDESILADLPAHHGHRSARHLRWLWGHNLEYFGLTEEVDRASLVENIEVKTFIGGRWSFTRVFQTEEADVSAVPEPSTALLLGIGIVSLSVHARRSRAGA